MKHFCLMIICVCLSVSSMAQNSGGMIRRPNNRGTQNRNNSTDSKQRDRTINNFKYDNIRDFQNGYACVEINKKWGFIDNNGREVIPCRYEDVKNFSIEGVAPVKTNGKWGYIDKTGSEVIEFKYDDAYSFYEGLGEVKLDGKIGFVDRNGSEVIPCKYDYA